MSKLIRAFSVTVIGAALALTGCSSSSSGRHVTRSSPASATSTAAPDAAITHAAAAAVVQGYATRNVRAIAAALNPPYDEKAWSAVDSGPVLAADAYDTKSASLKRSKQPKATTAPKAPNVLRAYGSPTRSSDGQQPWTLVISHRDGSRAPDASVATGSIYVKGAAGWRMDAGIGGIKLDTLPTEAKRLPSLTAAQRQAAADAVPVVVDTVATGTMSRIANPAPLKAYRKAIRADGSKGYLVGANCRPWGTPVGTDADKATVVGTDALRLARVGAQTLAVLNLDCQLDTYAQDGGQVQIPGTAARVEGDDGKAKDEVLRRSSLMILLSIPDAGKPKILGADGTYLIPDKH